MTEPVQELLAILDGLDEAAIAVSGGIDSMVLATLSTSVANRDFEIFHAVSPAVQRDGTARVRRYAARYGWRLRVIDTGEFADRNYLENPINRCFYCKSNLYQAMRAQTGAAILSGTNASDLGDFRPGLQAASDHGVRHPYVEAGIAKPEIRKIASDLALTDLAVLPAQPCLSSRVRTGIAISPKLLEAIYRVEQHVQATLKPEVVRCRYAGDMVRVELDAACLDALTDADRTDVMRTVQQAFAANGRTPEVAFSEYRMGSAFVHQAGPA
ncbi:MAG: adenine nucleotide alpha hydrolase [Methyloligellaceae bacterium]